MKGTILVVDDERQMAKTLSAVLRLHGWATIEAYSGEQAVESAGAQPFDAIIMDVRMPGIDGVEAFRQIRKSQPRVPVILMTAYSAHELIAQAEREGVLSVVPKPIPWPRLTTLLDRAIEARQSILLVDHDPDFADKIAHVLAERGCMALRARTLAEALTLLEREGPQVVILDLEIEQLDSRGVLTIKQINPQVALILCSAQPRQLDETIASLPPEYVYAGLKKPFAPEALINLLDQLHGHSKRADRSREAAPARTE